MSVELGGALNWWAGLIVWGKAGRESSVYKAREGQILSRWAEQEIWRFGGDQREDTAILIIRHPADPHCWPGPGIQMRCSVK